MSGYSCECVLCPAVNAGLCLEHSCDTLEQRIWIPSAVLMLPSLFLSRWRDLPGHLQGLFAHGFQQPWEAQTPQCRPQNVTSAVSSLSLTQTTKTGTKNMQVSNSQAFPPLATCHMLGHSPAGVDFSGGWTLWNSEFFVQTRHTRTIVPHWNSFMGAAGGVCMCSREWWRVILPKFAHYIL